MNTVKKIKTNTENIVREFVQKLNSEEKKTLLNWSEKALTIRNNKDLSTPEKIKALVVLENQKPALMIAKKLFKVIKNKVWTNQSWARRLGFMGFGAGLTFSGTAVGIATMGAAMGIPLMVMTAAGGVVLGAAIDEIKKELNKN